MEISNKYSAEVVGGIHGVTCIFPTLKSIIDYEENDKVPYQGYPRFIAHPYVVAVQENHKRTDKEVFAIQSPEAANFVHLNYFDLPTRNHSFCETQDKNGNKYGLIYVDKDFAQSAKNSITNAGVILSSRKAERILKMNNPPVRSETLNHRLSQLEKGSIPALTFDYTSGMSAIFDAITSLITEAKSIAVIGNTYP
jgi:hypothetical protein